ncbi:MAG TPA: AAA family ATPase [Allocoleopsis sp.]
MTSKHLLNQSTFYQQIMVENFRTFRKFEINNLGRINLFVGHNNAGKTSLLEAISAHSCCLKFSNFISNILLNRSSSFMLSASGGIDLGKLDLAEKMLTVFYPTQSLPYTFTITVKNFQNEEYKLKAQFYPSKEISDLDPRFLGQANDQFFAYHYLEKYAFLGEWRMTINDQVFHNTQVFAPFHLVSSKGDNNLTLPSSVFHDILSHRDPLAHLAIFSHLKRYKLLDQFTQEMAKVFPEIVNIDLIPYPDGKGSNIYINTVLDHQLPLNNFGDGLKRWYYLLGEMLINQNSIHCIEEIDTTFDHESQPELCRLLVEYAEKFNNQLFVTSHNLEFIDTLLNTLYDDVDIADEDDPVRLFTLKKKENNGIIHLWSMTGKDAYRSRNLYNLELRG